ncbi:MAG: bifunctional DNA-formamidopyrimidine glycosylase/DNA-(apurinic or apyrimidinic site) lyase [Proteobacteria bacterium]|nr:bifunctional DNA-formamidopyrimidine glycosylase/DNA-(apurinic or apyrimidinic site) lyase [Pseudomonadota bacterium]
MPELPEVETTRAGLAPHLEGRRVQAVVLRRPDLRWPIPDAVRERLPGQRIQAVRRRAKYLLIDTAAGTALWHLGMSGSLRVLPADAPLRAHDHVDLALEASGDQPPRVLRFNDPRRFGCLLWQPTGEVHPLLSALGPEPLPHPGVVHGASTVDAGLATGFDGDYLFALSRGRSAPVKNFLMDQRVVVGVGNIYAAEALFAAGISPLRPAGRISRLRYARLVAAVQAILAHAITRGGTTLRDFISPDGAPGYFEQELFVYGRGGEPCRHCARPLKQAWVGQRATVWCAHCQR